MKARVDHITGRIVDRALDLLSTQAEETCDCCGAHLINRCLLCGAPVCCPGQGGGKMKRWRLSVTHQIGATYIKELVHPDGDWVRHTDAAELEQERDELRAMLWGFEWQDDPGGCVICDQRREQGHADDCRLAALLAKVE